MIHLFFGDIEIFFVTSGHQYIFCDVCLLPGKTVVFFDELTDGNLQWTDKSRCSIEQLNIVKSTLALNLLLVTQHLNSWKNEPVLSLINYTTKKKIFCENKFSVQNRSTSIRNIDTWQERTPFLQNSFQLPSGCFWSFPFCLTDVLVCLFLTTYVLIFNFDFSRFSQGTFFMLS